MGQRLNIEIVDGEESLANCYYHWSAYTVCALNLVYKIIEAYKSAKSISGVDLAVELLEATGAGVPADERKRMASDEAFKNVKFQVSEASVNRNDGLIGVTEQEKKSTREWEEGRVTIDIGSETFDFDVCCVYRNSEYNSDAEEYGYDPLESLSTLDIGLDDIPFRKIGQFVQFAEDHPNAARLPGECAVAVWIA